MSAPMDPESRLRGTDSSSILDEIGTRRTTGHQIEILEIEIPLDTLCILAVGPNISAIIVLSPNPPKDGLGDSP